MDIQVDQLHGRLLKMMKEFHTFCVDNGIRYYIIGGTALGAARHKGFIPWDDDMDIAIPRPDYNRLIQLSEKLPDGLEFMFYKNMKESPAHYIKLVDANTTLIERFYLDIVEGLYIDVFPLDGANKEEKNEIKRHKKIFGLYRKILWHCETGTKKGILRKVYKKYCELLDLNKLHDKIEELLDRVEYDKGKYIVNFLGAYRYKEFIPAQYFGKPTLYEFEDTSFFGPEKLEEYLTCLYGDYMKLPPIEKRQFHHQYHYLNLDQPYREYLSTMAK